MNKLFKLFALLLFTTIYLPKVHATTVTDSQKACLLQATTLIDQDFIRIATSSDLYEVDLDQIYELDYSACGYDPQLEYTFVNVHSLTIANLNLTQFDFSYFPNVLFIDASNNQLTDIQISSANDLSWWMVLDLANNNISSSNSIIELLTINPSLVLNINNNPLSDDFYHQLYTLGVPLDYTPELTIYLDGIPQDTSSTMINYVATSTDLRIETKYTTNLTIKNATGTDLNYNNHFISLLPGDYTITASNDRYQSVISITILMPEEPDTPTNPEIPDEKENPKEEDTGKEPEDNNKEEPKEDIKEEPTIPSTPIIPSEPEDEVIIEDIEIPESVVEETIQEENPEIVEENEEQEEITPISNEPIVEELPNTSEEGNTRNLGVGWGIICLGILMRISVYLEERKREMQGYSNEIESNRIE